jgi:hypothetical protein
LVSVINVLRASASSAHTGIGLKASLAKIVQDALGSGLPSMISLGKALSLSGVRDYQKTQTLPPRVKKHLAVRDKMRSEDQEHVALVVLDEGLAARSRLLFDENGDVAAGESCLRFTFMM